MSEKKSSYLEVLNKFPDSISPCRDYAKIYWLVKIADVTLSVKISCVNFPNSTDLKIYGGSEILTLIKENKELYDSLCSDSTSVVNFMTQFDEFIKSTEKKYIDPGTRKNCADTQSESTCTLAVLSQVQQVGYDKVSSLTEDFRKIELTYKDEMEATHKLEILVGPEYPSIAPVAISALPQHRAPTKSKSFVEIYNSWKEAVDEFVPAWTALSEFDRVCWVLDPDPPTPIHLYRRIAVAPSVSVQIEVDPTCPSDLPSLKFFGPDSKIGPLRSKLSDNSDDWDPENPLLYNLEQILDVEFPSKINMSREDLQVDCWICYSYNLEGETPSIVCTTDRCSACFHPACIIEWMKSLPDTRRTLKTMFGHCLYCKSKISVSVT